MFGYDTVIWRPGFAFLERRPARLAGYHRSLCIHSHVHRGTPQQPGLVFGLDRGGSCVGMAFRVAAPERDAVVAYLRERELVTHVSRETHLPVRLQDGESVRALTYVVDRGHSQYAGRMSPAEAAGIVRGAHGQSGPNVDYVTSALAHITEMGLKDRWLSEVVSRL